jgi:hypothetical protein
VAHASKGLGGSVAKRTLNCPGWRHFDVPAQPSSAYADEGTRLHELIAPLAMQGPLERASVAESLMAVALAAADARWPWPGREQTLVEQEVHLPVEGAFGTADLVIVYADRLVVCDWKFGAGVLVEATDNDQLMFYAAAVLHTFPELRRPLVELAIVQPAREPVLRLALTTPELLDAWLARYQAALAQDYVERGDWCRWCPVAAAGTCPAPTQTEILGQLLTQL